MARGTQERFAKYAHLQPSLAEADEQGDEGDLHPCVICGRLLGLHSRAQVHECSHRLKARMVTP